MQPMHNDAATITDARCGMAAGEPFPLFDDSIRSLAEFAHDARNMVTALGLYCELLEEPGVLSPDFRHYGSELKLLASASQRLVDKLMVFNAARYTGAETQFGAPGVHWEQALRNGQRSTADSTPLPDTLIGDLAFELQSNRNLLSTLAGPRVELGLEVMGGALPVYLSNEDLTRVLVNLLKNAAEAMPAGGRLQLTLKEMPAAPGEASRLLLKIEDNGPGIAADQLEQIFDPGYSTRRKPLPGHRNWTSEHLGLGLSITRSIVEAAGGSIRAASRDPSGTCFQIELPVRAG